MDAIIVGMEERITELFLRALLELKIIAKHGAGLDNIDNDAATKKKIPVVSAPGVKQRCGGRSHLRSLYLIGTEYSFADGLLKRGMARLVGLQINEKVSGSSGSVR